MTQLRAHRFAGDQRSSVFVPSGDLASSADDLQHGAISPSQCGYVRHSAFDKAATPPAWCTQTALVPQYAGPNSLLRRFIGGRHTPGLRENPQRILDPQNVASHARRLTLHRLHARLPESPQQTGGLYQTRIDDVGHQQPQAGEGYPAHQLGRGRTGSLGSLCPLLPPSVDIARRKPQGAPADVAPRVLAHAVRLVQEPLPGASRRRSAPHGPSSDGAP